MSLAQEYLDALRQGNFDKLLSLCHTKKITDAYLPVLNAAEINNIGAAEAILLIAYEFVKTDIKQDDVEKLYLFWELIRHKYFYADFPDYDHIFAELFSTMLAAVVIKEVDNDQTSVPKSVDKTNIKAFLNDSSPFSKLWNEASPKIDEIQTALMKQKVLEVVNTKAAENPDDPFFSSISSKKGHTHPIETCAKLETICQTYLDRLTDIIEMYLKENNAIIYDDIFAKQMIPHFSTSSDGKFQEEKKVEHGGLHRLKANSMNTAEQGVFNTNLEALKKKDPNFARAIDKALVVLDLQAILQDPDKNPREKLSEFKEAFTKKRPTLHILRDSHTTTFLKGVLTIVTLGVACAFHNFWKSEGKRTAEEIDKTLNPKP